MWIIGRCNWWYNLRDKEIIFFQIFGEIVIQDSLCKLMKFYPGNTGFHPPLSLRESLRESLRLVFLLLVPRLLRVFFVPFVPLKKEKKPIIQYPIIIVQMFLS
jgi:hypothetical protein